MLDQSLVDAFYGAVKTLVTVDPNPEVQDGPKWFKVVISLSMLVALLFAAAFTGGLVERLIGRNLTGLLGRRAVPRSDHVVVVGLGQVGLRLCMLLRECGISVVAIDDQPDGENVGHARQLGLPVVIGRGADPSLLRRLSLDRAIALAAVTADDLQNIKVALAARAEAGDLRVVLRAGSNATGGETRSLERLGHVRDVHRIGAVYIAGIALGSAAAHVVVDGDTAHLRDADGGSSAAPTRSPADHLSAAAPGLAQRPGALVARLVAGARLDADVQAAHALALDGLPAGGRERQPDRLRALPAQPARCASSRTSWSCRRGPARPDDDARRLARPHDEPHPLAHLPDAPGAQPQRELRLGAVAADDAVGRRGAGRAGRVVARVGVERRAGDLRARRQRARRLGAREQRDAPRRPGRQRAERARRARCRRRPRWSARSRRRRPAARP